MSDDNTISYPIEDGWSQIADVLRQGWMQFVLVLVFTCLLLIGRFFNSSTDYTQQLAEEFEQITKEREAQKKIEQQKKEEEDKRYVDD